MGAFILFDKHHKERLDLSAIQSVFSNKGFTDPYIVTLGESELYLYQKQLVDVKNYYSDGEQSIYAIGTVVYKGLGYHDTLKQLLYDYLTDSIEYDRIIGSYCVIIYANQKIQIINDALNVCELFTDTEGRFITSSFLAAANAVGKLNIDRNASLEKLLTGYIVGEATLFSEVKRIIPGIWEAKWNIHRWGPIIVPDADKDRGKCLLGRVNKITEYLKDIQKLAEEYKPELGLSGGYDSRLIFAATLKAWPFILDVHTHSTEGVQIHHVEREIVTAIAEKTGAKLRVVPTHNLDYYSGSEIEDILKDGYYYFDGRCAYNMGAFSPTYTRKYKIDTISGHHLTLNGLGGEMYRNYLMNIKPVMSTKQWMKAKVYPDGVDYIINKETFNHIHRYICEKMRKHLAFPWRSFITSFQIRRYYSEMRMPDCDALNCNADNQMDFYLTPFIEKAMVEDAYKARKQIGLSGEFQAEMTKMFSPAVASFNSHYGYSFDKKEPLSHKVYMLVRGLLPDFIWNLRINKIVGKNTDQNGNKLFFERVRDKCKFLSEAAEYTEKLFPEINFRYLRTDYAMMPNSSYISVVFYMLKDRINHEG